jgi:hypothetical protein
LPAVVLLADRCAEAYAPAHSSPPPEPPSAGIDALTVKKAAPASQDVTAAGSFIQQYRAPAERQREALRVLARWIGSEEAYLFTPAEPEPKQVAALGSELAADELLSLVRRVLCTPRGGLPASEWLSVRAGLAPEGAPRDKQFRVVPLPGDSAARSWIAAVALRDEAAERAEIPFALLADVGRALAQREG